VTTVQPPVQVRVRRDRWVSPDEAKVRGRIVGAAFDQQGNLWAYAMPDEAAPLVSPYAVMEYGGWPFEGDEFVGVYQGWNLGPSYGGGVKFEAGLPVFVYVQTLPEGTGA
jgi:hypothetical protein